MHTTLDTMTQESSPVYVNFQDDRLHSWPGLIGHLMAYPFKTDNGMGRTWNQSSIISISGQLPFPDVGHAYYWFTGSSPLSSVPVTADGNTYCLTAEVSDATGNPLKKAAMYLDNFQSLSLQAALLAAAASSPTNISNPSFSAASGGTNISQLMTQVFIARSNLLDSISNPGIIVARWTHKSETSGDIKAADYGSISAKSEQTRSGYVLMNGLRIRTLYPGSDINDYYTNLMLHAGIKNRKNVGVVTYLEETKELSYAQDYEQLTALAATLDLSKVIKTLTTNSADQNALKALMELNVMLEVYRTTITQLGVYGNLSHIQWKRTDFKDLKEIDSNDYLANGAQGWIPVYAVLTAPVGLKQKTKESRDPIDNPPKLPSVTDKVKK
jgi:hypothetical protein